MPFLDTTISSTKDLTAVSNWTLPILNQNLKPRSVWFTGCHTSSNPCACRSNVYLLARIATNANNIRISILMEFHSHILLVFFFFFLFCLFLFSRRLFFYSEFACSVFAWREVFCQVLSLRVATLSVQPASSHPSLACPVPVEDGYLFFAQTILYHLSIIWRLRPVFLSTGVCFCHHSLIFGWSTCASHAFFRLLNTLYICIFVSVCILDAEESSFRVWFSGNLPRWSRICSIVPDL
ncbi:hypothetical protein VTO42DRAFT_5707 [Malbranchea cinnamomea]